MAVQGRGWRKSASSESTKEQAKRNLTGGEGHKERETEAIAAYLNTTKQLLEKWRPALFAKLSDAGVAVQDATNRVSFRLSGRYEKEVLALSARIAQSLEPFIEEQLVLADKPYSHAAKGERVAAVNGHRGISNEGDVNEVDMGRLHLLLKERIAQALQVKTDSSWPLSSISSPPSHNFVYFL